MRCAALFPIRGDDGDRAYLSAGISKQGNTWREHSIIVADQDIH
jgi:hypothetical protein